MSDVLAPLDAAGAPRPSSDFHSFSNDLFSGLTVSQLDCLSGWQWTIYFASPSADVSAATCINGRSHHGSRVTCQRRGTLRTSSIDIDHKTCTTREMWAYSNLMMEVEYTHGPDRDREVWMNTLSTLGASMRSFPASALSRRGYPGRETSPAELNTECSWCIFS